MGTGERECFEYDIFIFFSQVVQLGESERKCIHQSMRRTSSLKKSVADLYVESRAVFLRGLRLGHESPIRALPKTACFAT